MSVVKWLIDRKKSYTRTLLRKKIDNMIQDCYHIKNYDVNEKKYESFNENHDSLTGVYPTADNTPVKRQGCLYGSSHNWQ